MNDEWTNAEVVRALKDVQIDVKELINLFGSLDKSFIPRREYTLQRDIDEEHRRELKADVDRLETKMEVLEKDTFSKKSMIGIITALALVAGGIGALLSALHL